MYYVEGLALATRQNRWIFIIHEMKASLIKYLKLKKGVGIAIKSKETSSKLTI